MTSKQYRTAIAKLGLTQAQAAEMLGVSIRTSSSYANGKAIPVATAKLLTVMLKLRLTPDDVKNNLRKK